MEIAEGWSNYSKIFIDILKSVEESVLRAELPMGPPTGGKTTEDLLSFVVMHETFHIGQMRVIRKALGYKAMQWFSRQ